MHERAPPAGRIPPPGLGFVLWHCALPIVVGGAIYLLFRDDSLLMFRWAQWIGADEPIAALRMRTLPLAPALPGWLLYSAPDGVWVYASTAFFARLWHDGPGVLRALWIGAAPAMALGGEAGQALGLVPGTFDATDLAFYAVAAAAAWILARRAVRRVARST